VIPVLRTTVHVTTAVMTTVLMTTAERNTNSTLRERDD